MYHTKKNYLSVYRLLIILEYKQYTMQILYQMVRFHRKEKLHLIRDIIFYY